MNKKTKQTQDISIKWFVDPFLHYTHAKNVVNAEKWKSEERGKLIEILMISKVNYWKLIPTFNDDKWLASYIMNIISLTRGALQTQHTPHKPLNATKG